MTETRFILLTIAVIVLQPNLAADGKTDGLHNFFVALAGQPDAAGTPDQNKLLALIDKELPEAAPADIEAMVPLIQKCLLSDRAGAHAEAIIFLVAVRSRLDSAQLLEPYVDYLNTLLDGSNNVDKGIAIGLLGGALLKPSPREVAALAAHLNDPKNTNEQFRMIASALLWASPHEAGVVHEILAGVKKRPQARLESGLINDFGLLRTNNVEALEFIRNAFQNPAARESCVQAVGRMPRDVRTQFQTDLQRVAEDPDVPPELRSAAQQVLLQP